MRTEAPSGVRWGFRPMDWTRGYRSGEPARSQALFCAYIARSTACRCCLPVRGFDGYPGVGPPGCMRAVRSGKRMYPQGHKQSSI